MSEINKKLEDIRSHWQGWANEYGDDLRATTRSSNIKELEIKVLIESISELIGSEKKVLEVGCGNGYNAISISKALNHNVDGFDFIPEMIDSANSNLEKLDSSDQDRLSFFVGDVLNMSIDNKYDLIYSCRCLINLPSKELQDEAIRNLLDIVEPGGYLLLLENFIDNFESQNEIRASVGLKNRVPAEFNHFFSSSHLADLISKIGSDIIDVKNFASLHDVIQYAVVPMLNDGVVKYDHDVINKVTNMLMSLDSKISNNFGDYGQNKLVIIKKN